MAFSPKNGCIIHSSTVSASDNLVQIRDANSWNTLLEAAKLRNYAPVLEKENDSGIPDIAYHRNCRTLFTLKRDLEKINQNEEQDENIARPTRSSTCLSNILPKECIFCQKSKYIPGTHSREKLNQVLTKECNENILKSGTLKGDNRILSLSRHDLIASEAHYHLTCYRDYTRKLYCEKSSELQLHDDTNQTDQKQLLSECFENFYKYVDKCISNKYIATLSDYKTKLGEILTSKNVEFTETLKKNFKRTIEIQYGEKLCFVPITYHDTLVVPHNITFSELVAENFKLKEEVKYLTSSDINHSVCETALTIRSEIKRHAKSIEMPWPYHPSDVDNIYYSIPKELQSFYRILLTGDINGKELGKTKLLIDSFSQDVMYAVSNGKIKPPKHYLLPYCVKTLTGNVEIIKQLNRFGHGISYHQLEENDTALCLQKLAASENSRIVLPFHIKQHIFTNLAWDNIDRLEETLSGKGTSHRINGIAVQPKVFGPDPQPISLPAVPKNKKRSVEFIDADLTPYISGERVGPQIKTVYPVCKESEMAATTAKKGNLAWILTRLVDKDGQIVPGWTGFNILARNREEIHSDRIAYLPTINAPPSELTTVYEILVQSEEIRKHLHLKNVVVVMDQALYSKAAEILWQRTSLFPNIVLRLGAFHTILNLLGIIGKRFKDAGLIDVCIESGLLSQGSVNGVVDGRVYNRAIRVHKCIYEALMRLIWKKFIGWVKQTYTQDSFLLVSMEHFEHMKECICQEKVQYILTNDEFSRLFSVWLQFLRFLRESNGNLSAFWMSYIDLVEILLGLIRASREGDWLLHLNSIENMIPWCFAYDKFNYARYLPIYLQDMLNLINRHPDIHKSFLDGYFSVQISEKNTFGKIPVDQATEITVNKDTQTPGGTTRFSLKSSAVKRYYITAEHRSAFLCKLRELTGNTNDFHHRELSEPRILRDEQDVNSVFTLFESWNNPFDNQELLIISTAKQVPEHITLDLLKAKEVGLRCYEEFMRERILLKKKKFHDPLSSNRLKTTTDMTKTRLVKSGTKETILKADRSLFARIIIISQARDLSMAEVLSHPLGPLPWALATPDGMLKKTKKSALASELQIDIPVVSTLPNTCAIIIDGMAIVQKLSNKVNEVSYEEVAQRILKSIISEAYGCSRIDVVFDTYRENSIKNCERAIRGQAQGVQLLNIHPRNIVRQFKKFLSTAANKSALIKFLVHEWQKDIYSFQLHGRVFYSTVGNTCFVKSVSGNISEAKELNCCHEEADTRMLLHAAHAAKSGFRTVVIASEDTDVFICAMASNSSINTNLYQRCGTKERKRLIDISAICQKFGNHFCNALPGLHAFTGCDTVSAFSGKGKIAPLRLLIKDKKWQDLFSNIGQDFSLNDHLRQQLEAFTCQIYAPKTPISDVNKLRYDLFCAKKGEMESHQLPPCQDCLSKHSSRANYQAAIWRKCLLSDPKIPLPMGYGWKMEQNELVIDWMDGQPAPLSVLELLCCKCTKKCNERRCACMNNGLKCTEMCNCGSNCTNLRNEQSDNAEDISFSDSDEDEMNYLN